MAVDHASRLRETARRGAMELEGASALEILSWADEALRGRMVVASSMQDAVVIDLAVQVHEGIDVVFLDTGYHFAETLTLRDAVAARYPVRLLNVEAGLTVAEQDAAHGPRLHDRDPDLCCFMRKVTPLNAVLGLYDGWVTGVRRVDTEVRASASAVEWDERRQLVKVNPILEWTDRMVEDYITDHGVMVNLLRSDGYPSIGCAPCTRRAVDGGGSRSGRWSGSGKTECGIHVP
jgi:phosphoadenosine phosphosulfate reductase